MEDKKIPLLIIAGPTATGKTEVAVKIAKRVNGEVVSADSMLVYRGMDIGTAKPTEVEKQGIPHHLIDVVDPDDEFTAAMFQKQAREAITEIHDKGRLPMLVGGTGFYIDVVIYEYDFGHAAPSPELRQYLWREAKEKGNEVLYNRLKLLDPSTAEKIHANNLKRIIRALEIFYQTGVSGAPGRKRNKKEYPLYDKLFFCLYYEREKLYRRIEERVDKMLEAGLVREVEELLERGYQPDLVSMQGLGYKEIAGYLLKRYSMEEAVHLLKRNTRRFAKRQLTWFNRYSNIKWIDMGRYESVDQVAKEIADIAGTKWQVG